MRQSCDGAAWQQARGGGWGNGNRGFAGLFDKAIAVFDDSPNTGTANETTGGQVWRRLHAVYLPLVVRAE